MLNNAGDGGVDFLSHFVQEVGHLDRRQHKVLLGFRGKAATYRLDEPTVTTKFEPA
jgi:hypothetical protein